MNALFQKGLALFAVAVPVLLGGCGVPPGTIAAFDNACPDGWTQYASANGKFLRGAEQYDAGNPNYGTARTGGAAEVTLTVEHVPQHEHTAEYLEEEPIMLQEGYGLVFGRMIYDNETTDDIKILSPDDTPSPVPVLPPYWTVNYCQKD